MRRGVVGILGVSALLGAGYIGHAYAAGTTVRGTSIAAVKMVRSSGTSITVNGSDWTDIPWLSVNLNVPSGEQAIFLGRWAAFANNLPGSSLSVIKYRLLVGNAVASPSTGGAGDFYVSSQAYFERSSDVVPSGTYTVKLQAQGRDLGSGQTASLNISESHFTVERFRA
jgi:hypothetical protein